MARQGKMARTQGRKDARHQGKARQDGKACHQARHAIKARQGIKACHQGMPSRQGIKARWQGKMARTQGKDGRTQDAGRQDAAKWRSIVIQILKEC